MSILVRRNKGKVHTYNVQINKVAEVIQLFNRMGYDIIKVGK